MTMQPVKINEQEAEAIRQAEEGQFSDVKSISVKPANLTKTISAFANSDGGDLYIGIEDSTRAWSGFLSIELANGFLQIFEKLFPLGNDFSYSFIKCDTMPGLLLQVHVNKTQSILKASNGMAYIRRGAQNLPQSNYEEIRRLEYAKGISTFETEPVNIDKNIITTSSIVKKFIKSVVPLSEPEPWLKKQALIKNEKPTVAGTVLFADEPQAYLPKHCGIKIYRYKTTESEGFREALEFDPETIEGSLYDQIQKAVKRTTKIAEQTPILAEGALKKISYPPQALHEIITNAIIHRDYSIADDVHIRIFDNRIEVQSPGKLPAHITIQNILDERFARNGTIVRILNKFPDPPNKDVGEGLNTAFASLTDIGLKEPVISERGHNVLVIIKHELMASPEEAIMDYLENNNTINNRMARRITHITADYRIKLIFGRMVKAKLIAQVPGTKTANTCYSKIRNKK
jgi:ATP-dependent DNA helicase RecG